MAANEKKTTIVIKKVNVVAGGGHGGSWKVAFADFMTSMMAFFLVMWLVNQSAEVKKNVSEYFSTPSIIEYNFSNYGVELTLEKLFLDLLNEPLKAVQDFITPVDRQPNIMDMGLQKIQMRFLEDKVGEFAKNMKVTDDRVTFDIPADTLFEHNSANPTSKFVPIMERIRDIAGGLKDSNIYINSDMPFSHGNSQFYHNIADARLDLVSDKVEQGIRNEGVDVFGKVTVRQVDAMAGLKATKAYIRFRIDAKKQPKSIHKTVANPLDRSADQSSNHTSARSVQDVNGAAPQTMDDNGDQIYDNFVNKLTKKVEGLDRTKR